MIGAPAKADFSLFFSLAKSDLGLGWGFFWTKKRASERVVEMSIFLVFWGLQVVSPHSVDRGEKGGGNELRRGREMGVSRLYAV